jgi:hypothetical protein
MLSLLNMVENISINGYLEQHGVRETDLMVIEGEENYTSKWSNYRKYLLDPEDKSEAEICFAQLTRALTKNILHYYRTDESRQKLEDAILIADIAVCMPAAGHYEKENIFDTLLSFTNQSIVLDKFCIFVFVNTKSHHIDTTTSEVRRFQQIHPEMNVFCIPHIWTQEEEKWLNMAAIRNIVTSIPALLSDFFKRDRELIALSFDADLQATSRLVCPIDDTVLESHVNSFQQLDVGISRGHITHCQSKNPYENGLLALFEGNRSAFEEGVYSTFQDNLNSRYPSEQNVAFQLSTFVEIRGYEINQLPFEEYTDAGEGYYLYEKILEMGLLISSHTKPSISSDARRILNAKNFFYPWSDWKGTGDAERTQNIDSNPNEKLSLALINRFQEKCIKTIKQVFHSKGNDILRLFFENRDISHNDISIELVYVECLIVLLQITLEHTALYIGEKYDLKIGISWELIFLQLFDQKKLHETLLFTELKTQNRLQDVFTNSEDDRKDVIRLIEQFCVDSKALTIDYILQTNKIVTIDHTNFLHKIELATPEPEDHSFLYANLQPKGLISSILACIRHYI